MSNNNIIPDFMSKNPNDIFKILLPLRLKIDHENYGNSHFEVIVENITKKDLFLYEMAPELLFQYFPIEKSFKYGVKSKYYTNKNIFEYSFGIDTLKFESSNSHKISNFLSDKNIVSLIGWKRKFLYPAKGVYCYHIEYGNKSIIIPHYAISIYYYFRFTYMREAAFTCRLDDIYNGCCCDKNDASIVLKYPTNDTDAAFIHRFACQKDAKNAFDDIGKYIITYLKYMKDNFNKEKIDFIPIKAKFPVLDEFKINVRVSKIINEETNKEYYFVHEIINDNSDLGFRKFTKYFQKDKIIQDIDSFEDLAVVKRDIPKNTTQILKVENAVKSYTQNYIVKDQKPTCNSLDSIEINYENITKDILIDLMKIYEKAQSNDVVHQSLTESSISGEKTIRKVVISSNYAKQESAKEYIYNFEIFNQYADFLKTQSFIENFNLDQVQKLPEIINKKTKRINPKGLVQGRAKKYITGTFKFKESYVGLLEIENATNATASTWVIVSVEPVNKHTFDKFINHYLGDNLMIQEMKNDYKSSQLKFTTKNHERTKDLKESDKINWTIGLISKIV